MFSVGEVVVYRSHGVCKIVGKRKMQACEKVRPYYVLEPVFERDSVYYAPIGNKQVEEKMHHVLSVKEVHDIIQTMHTDDRLWIENDKERQREYKQILDEYDRYALAKFIKSLHLHQKELEEQGKNLYAADRQFLCDAQKSLYDEFAFVLDIDQEQVPTFILEQTTKRL